MQVLVGTLLLGALTMASAVAGAPSLDPGEMAAARKLYVAKCAKCHKFYEPKNYSAQNWGGWMDSMNKKSKLKPDQAALLTRYLDAYRTGEFQGKPEDKPAKK